MQKAGKYRKRIFALLLTLCVAGTYMPSYVFAASEAPDTEELIVTEFSADGLSDGDKIVIRTEEDEKTMEKGKDYTKPLKVETKEGSEITVEYETGEASELQFTVSNVDVPKSDHVKKADTQKGKTVYRVQDRKGSFGIVPSQNASVEAKFTEAKIETASEPETVETAEVSGEEASEGDDADSDPAAAPAAEEPQAEPEEIPEAQEKADEPAPAEETDDESGLTLKNYDGDPNTELYEPLAKAEDVNFDALIEAKSEKEDADEDRDAVLTTQATSYDAKYKAKYYHRDDNKYGGATRFTVKATIDGSDRNFVGSCGTTGIPHETGKSWHKCKIQKVGASSEHRKALWYLVYEKGYWDGKDCMKKWNGTKLNRTSLVQIMNQIYMMGASDFKKQATEAGTITGTVTYDGKSMKLVEALCEWYKDIKEEAKNTAVPDTFDVYKVFPDKNGVQDGVVWEYRDDAYGVPNFTLVKAGAAIDDPRNLAGAQFQLTYYDVDEMSDIASANAEDSWTFLTYDKGTYAGFDWATDPITGDFEDVDRGLPVGWATIREIAPPPHYEISNDIIYIHIIAPESGTTATVKYYNAAGTEITSTMANHKIGFTIKDEPIPGYITLQKAYDKEPVNHPENYSLAGAVYYVYKDAACTERAQNPEGTKYIELITDASGKTNTELVLHGNYWVKEVTASEGCELDPTFYSAPVTEANTTVVSAQMISSHEQKKSGWVKLKKTPAKTDIDFVKTVPNNYEIVGAEYEVYTDAACTKRAKDWDGNDITFKTDANGDTPAVRVEIGDYYVKEKTAPKGYKLDPSVSAVNVTDANTESAPAMFNMTDEPVYSDPMSFHKVDTDGNFGWRKLLGTEYTIKFYDIDMGYGKSLPTAKTIEGQTPIRTWTFSTIQKKDEQNHNYAGFDMATDEPLAGSSEFFVEKGQRILPRGVITIQETKAAPEMALNKEVFYVRVGQEKMGDSAYKLIDPRLKEDTDLIGKSPIHIVEDEEQAIVIELRKKDGELDQSIAQGTDRTNVAGSLAGARYAVYLDDEKIGTIVTDEKGYGKLDKAQVGPYAQTPKKKLPYGKYSIKEEVGSPGYVLDSYYYNDHPEEAKHYEEGMHILFAKGDKTGNATVEYTVESKELSHHTYVSKKDITTGKELPGATLQVLDSKGNVVEEWVSGDKPHDIVALHDETQGLKDGKYTLREITAPYGYDVAEEVKFEVSSKKIKNSVEMFNKPITIGTVAIDDTTKTHHGVKSSEATLTDTVKITGLYKGRTYNVKGNLYDKKTGALLKDAEGKVVEAESGPFVATGDEMEVDVVFSIDSSKFDNEMTLVAYEYLSRVKPMPYEKDSAVPVELQKHEDPKDEDQTIHFGGIASTVAVDAESGKHNVLSAKNRSVTDTVAYKNLVVGQKYLLEGEWYDATAKKLTGVKSTKTFIAEKADGKVDVKFTFDTEKYEGHVLVCYERLRVIPKGKDGKDLPPVDVSKHEKPDDEAETIYIPKIRTTATAVDTKEHLVMAKKPVTIKDVVKFESLQPGKEYTFTGKLVLKDSGNDLVIDGKQVTAEAKYTPKEKDGEVELEFTFDASYLAGKTVVAFENVYEEKYLVGIHADLKDEEQSVHIPKIGTTAIDAKTKDHIGAEGETVTVIDTVAYENLLPGKEYVMRGKPMLKSNGEVLKDANGKEISAELKFTAEKENGSVDLTFEVPAKALKGDTIVAFEDLYFNEVQIAAHNDLTDEEQSVHIPEIGTTAVDSETKDHISLGDEEVTILDSVQYKNLLPGKKYKVSGTLMDKATGQPILADGKEITSSAEFTAEKADGEVVIEFRFNGSALQGKTVVAFENMYYNDVLIAVHANIEDEAQTVHIPEAKTNATDSETEDHIAFGDKKVVIYDMVTYSNLLVGKTYTVDGVLIDKSTGKAIQVDGENVTASATFTAEAPDGEVELKFSFDGRDLRGTKTVAFERVTYNGTAVAIHADLEDEAQTVTIPEIGTKIGKPHGKKITDTVAYRGLLTGRKYVVRGWLVDKKTGKKVAGSDGSESFTADSSKGTIDVELGLGKGSGSKVAFEEVYLVSGDEEILIGEHKDIHDEDQTYSPKPKTGDNDIVLLYGSALFLAVMLAAVLAVRRRRMGNISNK